LSACSSACSPRRAARTAPGWSSSSSAGRARPCGSTAARTGRRASTARFWRVSRAP
jgi:hypothetical protein